VDYSNIVSKALLKQLGLTVDDINHSIQLAAALREAVYQRRKEIRGEGSAIPNAEAAKEMQDEDDRIFLGAALFLAQKIKP
jgi:hypothetical protein